MATIKKTDFVGQSGQPVYNQVPIANPTTSTGWAFSENVRLQRYFVDTQGNLPVYPVVITDTNSSPPIRINVPADNHSVGVPSIPVDAFLQLFNPVTGLNDLARTGPTTMQSVNISTATTTSIIGAGGAGVKNRIWRVIMIQNAAAAVSGTWTLGDNSSSFNNIFPAQNPPLGTAAIEAPALVLDLGPNGILQPTANSAIEMVTSGTLNCTVWILYSVG